MSFDLSGGNAQWTINEEDGRPILQFSSFLSLDLKCESKVVSAPVEEGSFASYNKVETPLSAQVQLGLEGDDATLHAALDKLKELRDGIALVSLVTPNAEYQNLNLEKFSYVRKRENGLGAIWVDLSFVEVKQVEAEYANVEVAQRKEKGKIQGKTASDKSTREKKKSMLKMGGDWMRGK